MAGLANIGFTETQSTLQGPNQTTAASGSVAAISGIAHYKFMIQNRRAFYTQFTFPLLASQGSYLSGGGGIEYYFGQSQAAKTILSDSTTSLTITPDLRYFGFAGVNMGYIAYLTPTAKKNDTTLEIELGGGLSKKFTKFTLRTQASIARGTGVSTTTMGMKFFAGGIFFLD